jgi:hypothetical protein
MITGLSASETQRLSTSISRLLAHVRRDETALTGGVAIELGLSSVGRPGSRTSIADLDFVVSGPDAVAETVSEDFLVSHYHRPQPGVPKFMLQLVDPVTALRIDIFPDLVGSVKRARWFTLVGQPVRVLTLESILEHKLLTLSTASATTPVDPKHDDDARILGAVVGREVLRLPADALVKDVYGGEADWACHRCKLSRHPGFPLAPKDQIFKLLGWPEGQLTNVC